MQLEVPNPIVVVESKCLSKFDCQLWSDSDSNDKSKSTISIFDINSIIFDILSIKMNLFSINIDLF